MTPDELLSLADNPQLIPGIYNYCDRWCERCHVTSRCLLYATSPTEADLAKAEDPMAMSLQHVQDSFTLTMQLLQKMAEEKGIDLNAPDYDNSSWEEDQRLRRLTEKTPFSQHAKKYTVLSKKWLDNSSDLLQVKAEELQQLALMDLPDHDAEKDAIMLKDALDTIFWYQFQIYIKIVRAQNSRREDDKDPLIDDDGAPYPKDSDGSAKVAIIGLERSIGAWGILLRHFPDQETNILAILAVLQHILRLTEEEFPNARAFFRPGLDG